MLVEEKARLRRALEEQDRVNKKLAESLAGYPEHVAAMTPRVRGILAAYGFFGRKLRGVMT